MQHGSDVKLLDNRLVDFWFKDFEMLLERGNRFEELNPTIFKLAFLNDRWVCLHTNKSIVVGYVTYDLGQRCFWVVLVTGETYKDDRELYFDFIYDQLRCSISYGQNSPGMVRFYQRFKSPNIDTKTLFATAKIDMYEYQYNFSFDTITNNDVECLHPVDINAWWPEVELCSTLYSRNRPRYLEEFKQQIYNGQLIIFRYGNLFVIGSSVINTNYKEFQIVSVFGDFNHSNFAVVMKFIMSNFMCRYISFRCSLPMRRLIDKTAKHYKDFKVNWSYIVAHYYKGAQII